MGKNNVPIVIASMFETYFGTPLGVSPCFGCWGGGGGIIQAEPILPQQSICVGVLLVGPGV